MGGKGEFIQFLLTWAHDCPDAPLATHVQPVAEDDSVIRQLSSLFDQEHGFVLALLSRKYGVEAARSFLNTSNNPLRQDLVEQSLLKCQILVAKNPLLKGLRGFVGVDQIMNDGGGSADPFTKVYLRRTEGLSPMKTAFSQMLEELFARSGRLGAKSALPNQSILNTFIDRVSRFTYDLFENADRWGTNPYSNSIRGILVQLHVRETAHHKPLYTQVGTNNPLVDYLAHFVGDDGFEDTPFLEVTIFDNGPALAKHYLGRSPRSVAEESSATRKCLLLASGRSSKPTEGRGLYDTMKLLSQCRGMLHYRGNRLSVYRDFISDPLPVDKLAILEKTPPSEAEKAMMKLMFLRDWKTRATASGDHPPAVGALFTIVVPVKSISDENYLQL